MFDDQARHIAYIIAETQRRGATDGRAHRGGRQDAWVELINGFHVGGLSFLETCTPGYYNNEGHTKAGSGVLRRLHRRASTPSTSCSRSGATQGDLAGLELDGPG